VLLSPRHPPPPPSLLFPSPSPPPSPPSPSSPPPPLVHLPASTRRYAVEVVGSQQAPPLTVSVAPGWYGPASCGLTASVPLNITGAGPAATVIDCRGTDRVLHTNASLVLAGVRLTGGRAFVSEPPIPTGSDFLTVVVAGGGGALWVDWPLAPPALPRHAIFTDVVVDNSSVVSNVVSANATGTVYVGGGGILVSGSGTGAVVALSNCVATGNSVLLGVRCMHAYPAEGPALS
jgi:hypothetical protein